MLCGLQAIQLHVGPVETLSHAGLSAEQAQLFTLHSLKCTLLCWGNQLRISKSLRASQGHHHYTSVSVAVQKYGRDDVVGQIKFQQLVWKAVTGGWIPSIPLHRGVTRSDARDSLRVPCDNGSASNDVALGSDTEPEEEAEEGVRNPVSPEDVSAWSDGEDSAVPSDRSGNEANEAVEEVSSFPGPWLLNSKTGWLHRAVKVGDDGALPAAHELSCRSNTSYMTPIHALVAGQLVDIPVAVTLSLRPGPKCLC